MGFGLGYMLAGGLVGTAKGIGEVADTQAKEDAWKERFRYEAQQKMQWADDLAKKDAGALIAAQDAVTARKNSGAVDAMKAGLPAGAADGLSPEMMNDLAGQKARFDPSSSADQRAVLDELRRGGGASGDLLKAQAGDLKTALLSEKEAKALAYKENKDAEDRKLREAAEAGKDRRAEARLDAQFQMLDRRLAQTAALAAQRGGGGEKSNAGQMISALREERVGLDKERDALNAAMREEQKTASLASAKKAVEEKYAGKLQELERRGKVVSGRLDKIWERLDPSGEVSGVGEPKVNSGDNKSTIMDNRSAQGVTRVSAPEDVKRLPAGARFMGADGVVRVKRG